jgi:hypothetical protein
VQALVLLVNRKVNNFGLTAADSFSIKISGTCELCLF